MQLEWIDDILAVIDTGSLAGAAKRRLLSQPAFTRRVRVIEQKIGVTLFDRSRKPVIVQPAVRQLEPELREMSLRLRRLEHELRVSSQASDQRVVFACQHSLATTISPWLVEKMGEIGSASVEVRSGDRDECLMMLVSGHADFVVAYEHSIESDLAQQDGFDVISLGEDLLIPVVASQLYDTVLSGDVPIIRYPRETFLRRVFDLQIAPRLPLDLAFYPKAETALTLAACEYALQGMGIAWLPLGLVRAPIERGDLRQVDALAKATLHIRMLRLRRDHERRNGRVWEVFCKALPG